MANVGTVTGVAGMLLGGAALAVALAGRTGPTPGERDAVEDLRSEVRTLSAGLEEARKAADGASGAAARAEESVGGLHARLDGIGEAVTALQKGGAGSGSGAAARAGGDGDGDAADAPKGKVDPADPALRKEFRALRAKFLRGEASVEEQQRFWELAKAPGFLEALLAEQEGIVGKSPGDLEARMVLADDYVAKLLTLPPGPEMGVWGAKAEDQWKKILETDENHWRARFNLAFSWSQYPDFLNKTPDAIRQFEDLRTRQEGMAQEAKFSQTYLQLHLLYKKIGNADKAKEVLEEGLRRFPADAELKKLRESLGK